MVISGQHLGSVSVCVCDELELYVSDEVKYVPRRETSICVSTQLVRFPSEVRVPILPIQRVENTYNCSCEKRNRNRPVVLSVE